MSYFSLGNSWETIYNRPTFNGFHGRCSNSDVLRKQHDELLLKDCFSSEYTRRNRNRHVLFLTLKAPFRIFKSLQIPKLLTQGGFIQTCESLTLKCQCRIIQVIANTTLNDQGTDWKCIRAGISCTICFTVRYKRYRTYLNSCTIPCTA